MGGGLWPATPETNNSKDRASCSSYVEVLALELIMDLGAESVSLVDSLLHLCDTELQLPHLQSEAE